MTETELRRQLAAGDFDPVPLRGKRPFYLKWQKGASIPIDRWPRGNTGVLTARTPAIDIDVLDEAVADQIEDMVFKMVGRTLVRTGRAPKRALLYRTEEPFAKIVSPRFGSHRVRGSGRRSTTRCLRHPS